MSEPARTSRTPVADESAKVLEMRDNFTAHYTKGVERVAEIQKRSIDLALQHNQEAIALWKQATEKLPWAPRIPVLEQTAAALERVTETQKWAIDLMVEQTRAAADLFKDRSGSWKKTTDAMFGFAQESFNRTVGAQKKAAEAVMTHGKATYDKAREQFEFPGSQAVAETIQRGVGSVVEAQKAVLETVAP